MGQNVNTPTAEIFVIEARLWASPRSAPARGTVHDTTVKPSNARRINTDAGLGHMKGLPGKEIN